MRFQAAGAGDPLLEFMVTLAREAGRIVMAHYQKASGQRRYKKDRSPVTAADLAANRLIVSALKTYDPSIPVISEESPIPGYAVRRRWSAFWLVDPVDGTREFLNRTGQFTVNIALIRGGAPVAGVVFAPALELLYFGSAVSRSWKIEGRSAAQRIYPKPPLAGEPPRILVSRLHEAPADVRRLDRIPGAQLLRLGSSVKFGWVAEGRAHAYPRFGPTSEWDVAAGDAVWRYACEAGETNPSPLRYNKKSLKNGPFYIGWRP
jgi:3'(2'), 5'-bisphosphate nucleotidase